MIIHTNDFLTFADSVITRGHGYKLVKRYSGVTESTHFYVNRLCNIWNSLPETVVKAHSLAVSK